MNRNTATPEKSARQATGLRGHRLHRTVQTGAQHRTECSQTSATPHRCSEGRTAPPSASPGARIARTPGLARRSGVRFATACLLLLLAALAGGGAAHAQVTCADPSLGSSNTEAWRASVTVANLGAAGYGYASGSLGSALDNTDFTIWSARAMMVQAVSVEADGALNLLLDTALTTTEKAALTLYVCDTAFAFTNATLTTHSATSHEYRWTGTLDWSSATTRTLRASVAANADLNSLSLTGATLEPTFASATTSYTTTVENTVSRITVAPVAYLHSATVSFLDGDDTALGDADPTSTRTFEVDLDEGVNTVKVKVTAKGTTTTRTYAVKVVRKTAPGAPQSVAATALDTKVVLSWAAPQFDGGDAITHYEYRWKMNPGAYSTWTEVEDGADTGTSAADETSATVAGLMNGYPHSFQVRAVNDVADGAAVTRTATPIAASCAAPRLASAHGTLWSATLGVGTSVGGADTYHGFFAAASAQATPVGTLNDTTIEIGAQTYTVKSLVTRTSGGSTTLQLGLASTIATSQKDHLTLQVCGDAHTFASSTYTQPLGGHRYTWTYTGTSWAEVSMRKIAITGPLPGAPAGVTATAADGRVRLSWEAPETATGDPALTRYQYRHALGTPGSAQHRLGGRARRRRHGHGRER